jgi:hypothetical protein
LLVKLLLFSFPEVEHVLSIHSMDHTWTVNFIALDLLVSDRFDQVRIFLLAERLDLMPVHGIGDLHLLAHTGRNN